MLAIMRLRGLAIARPRAGLSMPVILMTLVMVRFWVVIILMTMCMFVSVPMLKL